MKRRHVGKEGEASGVAPRLLSEGQRGFAGSCRPVLASDDRGEVALGWSRTRRVWLYGLRWVKTRQAQAARAFVEREGKLRRRHLAGLFLRSRENFAAGGQMDVDSTSPDPPLESF